MRTLTFCSCSSLCIMLSFLANAQDRLPNGNLNKTVTHVNKASANVDSKQEQNTAVTHTLAKENTMPDNDKDFGIWAASITIFKQYFTENLPPKIRDGFDDGIHLSSLDWKKWTEEDLTKLATTFNGVDMFAGLSRMKNSAGIKDANGDYTKEAIQAQNALTELKPDCCKSWKSFYNMIIRVEDATESVRIPLMKRKNIRIPGETGALLDLHKNDNIAGNPLDNPAFDQQAALVQLEKAGVTKDAGDALKKPLETAVTDAVKGIKSSITLAA